MPIGFEFEWMTDFRHSVILFRYIAVGIMIQLLRNIALIQLFFASVHSCYGQSLIMRAPGGGTSAYYRFETQLKKPDGVVEKLDAQFILRRLKSEKIGSREFVWLEIEQNFKRDGDPVKLVTKILVPKSDAEIGGIEIRAAKKILHSSSSYKDGAPQIFDPKSRRAEFLLNFFPPKSIVKTSGKISNVKTPIGNLKCKSLKGTWTQETKASGTYKRSITVLTNDQVPFGTVQLEFNDSINNLKMTGVLKLDRIGMSEKSALPDSW